MKNTSALVTCFLHVMVDDLVNDFVNDFVKFVKITRDTIYLIEKR